MKRVRSDVSTERAVLSGIAQHGQQVFLDIADILDDKCFFEKSNQVIFACLEKALQYSSSIDMQSFLSAANELKVYDLLNNKTELEFIRSIFEFPIKKENVRPLAAKLKKLYITHLAQNKLEESHDALGDITGNESVDYILGLAESPFFEFSHSLRSSNDEQPCKILEEAEEYMRFKIDNKVDAVGLSSGLPIFDAAIGGGLRRGYVDLIGARPKQGKSTVANAIAMHCAIKLNIPILILDTEMDKDSQIHRMIAAALNINTKNIETGQVSDYAENKIFEFLNSKKNVPLFYKKISGKPFDEVLSIVRRWIFKDVGFDENGNTNNCLIIYDYFKLMDTSDLDKMQEYQALGFQISRLTDFCGHYQVPCLAFVQLNRDGVSKDTSDVISQSDRLLWLCGSFSILRRKTVEEIVEDGHENGNVKIIPLDCRFGPSLESNDYINLSINYDTSSVKELTTKKQALQIKKDGDSGFNVEKDDLQPFE